jgi:hypothetical protein
MASTLRRAEEQRKNEKVVVKVIFTTAFPLF